MYTGLKMWGKTFHAKTSPTSPSMGLAPICSLSRREALRQVDGLQGNLAIDGRIMGEVDPSHGSLSQFRLDAVAP